MDVKSLGSGAEMDSNRNRAEISLSEFVAPLGVSIPTKAMIRAAERTDSKYSFIAVTRWLMRIASAE